MYLSAYFTQGNVIIIFLFLCSYTLSISDNKILLRTLSLVYLSSIMHVKKDKIFIFVKKYFTTRYSYKSQNYTCKEY